MPAHSKHNVIPSSYKQASIMTYVQHKTTNKFGVICTGVSPRGQSTLLSYNRDYEILINWEPKVVAPLLYKTIIRLATLDENTTVTALWANLASSDNIPSSKTAISTKYSHLLQPDISLAQSWRIICWCLAHHPFHGLQGRQDATSHYYMRRLQDHLMDQTRDMQDATHDDIMKKDKSKYDLLVICEKWG